MSQHVSQTISNGVQKLVLTRADKKNALTQDMYRTLSDAFLSGDQSDDVRVHVLLGSGGVFTSGNDVSDFLAHATGNDGGSGLGEVMRFLSVLPSVKKPVIAGVEGLAIGIGTTLLFHCDMVFATPETVFATPFLNLGLVPEAGSSLLMPQRMGYARAFEMLVLGDTCTADDMKACGLVNKIVAPEKLETVTMDTAHKLAKKPKQALQLSRELMRGDRGELKKQVAKEAEIFAERLSSAEARAAFQAFLTKSA